MLLTMRCAARSCIPFGRCSANNKPSPRAVFSLACLGWSTGRDMNSTRCQRSSLWTDRPRPRSSATWRRRVVPGSEAGGSTCLSVDEGKQRERTNKTKAVSPRAALDRLSHEDRRTCTYARRPDSPPRQAALFPCATYVPSAKAAFVRCSNNVLVNQIGSGTAEPLLSPPPLIPRSRPGLGLCMPSADPVPWLLPSLVWVRVRTRKRDDVTQGLNVEFSR